MTKKSIMILFIVLVSPAVTYGFPIANDKFACPGTQYPITINQFVHNLSGVEGLFITGKERKSWFRGEDGLYYVKLENAEIGVTIRFGFRQQSGIAVMERLAVKEALNALKKLSMQDDMRAFNPQINITEKSESNRQFFHIELLTQNKDPLITVDCDKVVGDFVSRILFYPRAFNVERLSGNKDIVYSTYVKQFCKTFNLDCSDYKESGMGYYAYMDNNNDYCIHFRTDGLIYIDLPIHSIYEKYYKNQARDKARQLKPNF